MDSASSLVYPGSRAIVLLTKSLERHEPAALWAGYLWVHRVETLIEIAGPRPVDPLALHVLGALAIGLHPLGGRLHFPPAALRPVLIGLEKEGLVEHGQAECWSLSDRGRAVLDAGADTAPRRERHVFAFVEHLNPAGRRLAPPHYLPLAECPAAPWEVGEGHLFDPGLLHEAVRQLSTWKQTYGFPLAATSIVHPTEEDAAAWEAVVLDRPERVAIVLIATRAGEVVGFVADAAKWTLLDDAPVLRLPPAARNVLPDLGVPPSAWEEAWRLWCRQRHLPLSDAEACRLRMGGMYIDVHAPASLAQRLRLSRSEEESALLAGSGYLRAGALLRVHG